MSILPTLSIPPSERALRVLCADDNYFVRDIIARTLSRTNHTIQCASDGLEAKRLFDSGDADFDVLITDHEMPHLNGLDLVRHLKTKKSATHVIVISGNLNEALVQEYIKLGVQKILPKPFLPQNVIDAIAALPPLN